MITITVNMGDVISDVRNKSHLELQKVTDAEARYISEAGSEKMPEIRRCLIEAKAQLDVALSRFLGADYTDYASSDDGLQEDYVWELAFSERRASGKAQALADSMHAYLVDATLARYYQSVSQPDLSKTHGDLASADSSTVLALLWSKKPPIL